MSQVLIDRTNKRCWKRGHKSRGAAEAHMRSLLNAQERLPDAKPIQRLAVYYCIAKQCRAAPWHVGHDRYEKTKYIRPEERRIS